MSLIKNYILFFSRGGEGLPRLLLPDCHALLAFVFLSAQHQPALVASVPAPRAMD